MRHGGKEGGEEGVDVRRKVGEENPKLKEHETTNVTGGKDIDLEIEPAKHGRSKRPCRRQAASEKPQSKIDSIGGMETDGSGEAKVGAWDEVVMEAKEETSQGDSGMPRDEKGLWGLRVRDPGSGTAGE